MANEMDRRLEELRTEARGRHLLKEAEALHPDFDPEVDRVVRVGGEAVAESESEIKPYRLAAQLPLFKSGLLGPEVTVWSKATGPFAYEPTKVTVTDDEPLVVPVDDPRAQDSILFAAGYVYGWHESKGGDPEDLDIWLEPA